MVLRDPRKANRYRGGGLLRISKQIGYKNNGRRWYYGIHERRIDRGHTWFSKYKTVTKITVARNITGSTSAESIQVIFGYLNTKRLQKELLSSLMLWDTRAENRSRSVSNHIRLQKHASSMISSDPRAENPSRWYFVIGKQDGYKNNGRRWYYGIHYDRAESIDMVFCLLKYKAVATITVVDDTMGSTSAELIELVSCYLNTKRLQK